MSTSDINGKSVNKDTVIDWHLEILQSGDLSLMPPEIVDYLMKHPDVAAEVETLKQFWQPQEALPAPSSKLKIGFYQSLAQLQQSQSHIAAPGEITAKSVANDPYYKTAWFQAAAIVLVFVLGLFTGKESFDQPSTGSAQKAITALQKEVSSLSAVMAISMLQKGSASERLAAVSYTRRADMADPVLLQSLLTSFEQEKSTAVKLAIIDAFKATDFSSTNSEVISGELAAIEQSLLALALTEPQPMVQMALTQLLLSQGRTATKTKLIQQLQSSPIDQDVSDFLQLIDAQNRI